MAKYKTRVKTKFGEIVVDFDSTDDLKKSIESLDLDVVSDILSAKFQSVIAREPRKTKPGLEGVYTFTPEGRVELLKTPPSAPMTIGLLLYAYDPDPVSSDEIVSSSGVKTADYIYQIAYKKYFDKTTDGRLVLSHQGRLWVETEVTAKLISKTRNSKSK